MDMLQSDLKRDRQPGEALVLWLPVFLGIGAALYFMLPYEPSLFLDTLLFVAACGVGFLSRPFYQRPVWRYAMACALLVPFGLVMAQIRTESVDTHLVTHSSYNADVSGDIYQVERTHAGWRIVLHNALIDDETKPYTLRLSLRRSELTPEIGGHLVVKASLMPPSPPLLPGMYDFQLHAFFQRMGGYGYATKIISYVPPAKKNGLNLEAYRLFLANKVYQNVSQPEAGITTALLNGQRGGIARKTTLSLQQSGLFHIISISGLHVAIMAGIVFYFVRLLLALNMRLALTWPIKKIAAAFALVAIVLYMMVVGSDPATLRSVIMASIALIAIMLDREAINLRIVAIAALAILVFRPESVLDIGFQLSFAAVTALVAFYNQTNEFWQHRLWKDHFILKISQPVFASIVTSLVATLATAPLVFLNFQQIPVLSMVANVLAMPVVAFIIMPGTFFSYLLTPFPVIGDWVIKYMGFGVTLLLKISQFTTSLPLAVWRMPAVPVLPVLLMMIGLFLPVVLVRRWRLIGIAPIVFGLILLSFHDRADLYLTGNRLVVMPGPAGLYIDGRVDGFSRNLFLQFNGQTKLADFPCDTDICTITQKGKTIRILRTIESLDQACAEKADLILTRYYLDEHCADTMTIDRHVTDRHGGVAITLDPLHYTPVYKTFVRRPWQKSLNQGWSSQNSGVKVKPDDDQTTP